MVLDAILQYLEVEQGSIMILERRNKLVVCASKRKELLGHTQSLADSQSVASWVAVNQQPLFIPDIGKDKRFATNVKHTYKKNSLLSVPIVENGKTLGVINITDKAGEKVLLQDDIARLLDFSSIILSLLVQQNLHGELKKQKSILKKRNAELRRQEKMRNELSRMLIHDLKGPLSEVVANLDILSYSISDQNREFLESAQMGCDRAVRMVSNLVTLGKIEDGKMKLIREEAEPLQLLAESLSSMKGMSKIKDVELVLDKGDQLPTIKVDRIVILRVLQNLMTNAIGYSPPGTTIRIGCAEVPGKKRLRFYVQDQGPGIPLEKQRTIFEKYARISEKQDALTGTGLGLYFCRLAVEVHRGTIGIESGEGQGSRFYFTLPC
jgi:two-component system sensor histidine kinase KdpD